MKRIKLTAPRWHQKSKDGYIHRRAGQVIEIPDKDADRLIRIGAAVASRAKLTDPDEEADHQAATSSEAARHSSDADPVAKVEHTPDEPTEDEDSTDEQPDTEPADIEKPKATDSTDDWIAYAVAQGMDADEASSMNRTELRKHFA